MGAWGVVLVVAFMAIALGTIYVAGLRAGARQLKQLNIMLEVLKKQCDPEAYIEQCTRFLQKPVKNTFNRLLTQHNLAMAHHAAGRTQKAIELDLQILEESKKAGVLTMECIINSSLADLYIWQNKLNKAERYYRDLREFRKKLASRKEFMDAHRSMMEYLDARFQLARGEYEQARPYFEELFRKSPQPYDKATCAYILAELYGAVGDERRRLEMLSYIIDNGNTMYIVAEARAKLRQNGKI